jgi:glycosyltransferase involved in cell wall biosynthesis
MHTISVVTSTWNRHDLLLDHVIPSVLNQTYPGNIEHIIVSDGPDQALHDKLVARFPSVLFHQAGNRRLVYHDLGHNWQALTEKRSWGAIPRFVGTCLATGDCVAYLDDDNSYYLVHLEWLYNLLQERGVDFVYSKFYNHRTNKVVGKNVPIRQHIDTSVILHKIGLLGKPDCQWYPAGYASDYALISRWLAAGAKWEFLDQITVAYGIEKIERVKV